METVNKAKGMLKAVVLAEDVFGTWASIFKISERFRFEGAYSLKVLLQMLNRPLLVDSVVVSTDRDGEFLRDFP